MTRGSEPGDRAAVRYRTAEIEGLRIFYREAGDRRSATSFRACEIGCI